MTVTADTDSGEASRGPLTGVRVVDASSYMAGPFAGLMLSDLGATVVKVEPPGGDSYRKLSPHVNGVSVSAAVVNRGKRSVVIDLKSDSGREELLELVRESDVLLENWRPLVAQRLRLTQGTLAEVNPRLVHISVSGYGDDGPYAGRPAFDGIIQSEGGAQRLDGDRLQSFPTYLADKSTSVFAAQAVLAGLLQRHVTQRGTYASVPMIDALAYFNFPDLLAGYALTDAPPSELPRSFSNAVIRTSDGFVNVSPASGRQIKGCCEALGHPEWAAELKELGASAGFRDALYQRLESVSVEIASVECVKRFQERNIPSAVVLDPTQHFAHPQVQHNKTYQESDDSELGRFRFARYPAIFEGCRAEHSARLPSPGSDTEEPWGPAKPRDTG